MTSAMGAGYRRALSDAFTDTARMVTRALDLDRADVAVSALELARALDETDRFVRTLKARRRTDQVSKGKFAGALLYFLRQCRPIQLISEQDAIDKGVDATRFQDLVCVMFVCEFILRYRPPHGILLELIFLLRQNEASAAAIGLLFESFLILTDRTGPHYMDEAVV